ncbi:hypothetical protein ACFL5V_00590 [Fibrobacterota bacterium]
MIFFVTMVMAAWIQASDAPGLAVKGMQSYRDGKYSQARKYFTLAMQEAVLQAREDWIVMAVLNLVDLDLDALRLETARELLHKVPEDINPELQAAVLWKRAQYYFYANRIDSASVLIKRAGEQCSPEFSFYHSLSMDAYRIQFESEITAGNFESLKQLIKQFKDKLPKEKRDMTCLLEALIAMKERDYQSADELCRKAVDYHRARGQIPRMAKCLNYLALSEFMNGNRQSARETNARAVGAYEGLSLALPGLRAYALNIFLVSDSVELEKIKSNLELISESQPGFDLKAVIKDYQKFANLSLPPALSYMLP